MVIEIIITIACESCLFKYPGNLGQNKDFTIKYKKVFVEKL